MTKKADRTNDALHAFRRLPAQARQAPAAYRPLPQPKVLQRKTQVGSSPASVPARPRVVKPQAPPVYRPQAPLKVLQTKKSLAASAPHKGCKESRPIAPPVYRPQPAAKVLQRKVSAAAQPVNEATSASRNVRPAPAVTRTGPPVIQRAQQPGQRLITDYFALAPQQPQHAVAAQLPAHALAAAAAIPQVLPPPQPQPPALPQPQPPALPQPAPPAIPQPPAPAPQQQIRSPGDMMDSIEYGKAYPAYHYQAEVVYFAVENTVRGPFLVTAGTHAERNALTEIVEVMTALGRPAAFVCIYSTYSPCKEYTATGSQSQHNCAKLMSDLLHQPHLRAAEWYFRYTNVWEGDGNEERRKATRVKSQQGVAQMKDAGWKFI